MLKGHGLLTWQIIQALIVIRHEAVYCFSSGCGILLSVLLAVTRNEVILP